jgi:hypothetical protein
VVPERLQRLWPRSGPLVEWPQTAVPVSSLPPLGEWSPTRTKLGLPLPLAAVCLGSFRAHSDLDYRLGQRRHLRGVTSGQSVCPELQLKGRHSMRSPPASARLTRSARRTLSGERGVLVVISCHRWFSSLTDPHGDSRRIYLVLGNRFGGPGRIRTFMRCFRRAQPYPLGNGSVGRVAGVEPAAWSLGETRSHPSELHAR